MSLANTGSDFPKDDLKEEDITTFSDGHGNELRCVGYGGHYLSARGVSVGRFPNPRVNFPRLRETELREDDIFLLAYPKAGTHWTNEIIHMLRHQKLEYDVNKKEVLMYEFLTPAALNKLPSPRTINSHLRLSLLPKQLEERKHKIVFVQRNPKDIAVSFYFHTQALVKYTGTFTQFLDMFMSGQTTNEPWTDYALYYEEALEKYPKDLVHRVYFEDLKENPISEIKRLAKFLEKSCDDKFAEDIAHKCKFDNLKEANLNVKAGKEDQHMFRKGSVGDWKNWFTVAKNEEFNEFLRRKMSKSKFCFKYEINM